MMVVAGTFQARTLWKVHKSATSEMRIMKTW